MHKTAAAGNSKEERRAHRCIYTFTWLKKPPQGFQKVFFLLVLLVLAFESPLFSQVFSCWPSPANLKLNSPLSVTDRGGFQLKICWPGSALLRASSLHVRTSSATSLKALPCYLSSRNEDRQQSSQSQEEELVMICFGLWRLVHK